MALVGLTIAGRYEPPPPTPGPGQMSSSTAASSQAQPKRCVGKSRLLSQDALPLSGAPRDPTAEERAALAKATQQRRDVLLRSMLGVKKAPNKPRGRTRSGPTAIFEEDEAHEEDEADEGDEDETVWTGAATSLQKHYHQRREASLGQMQMSVAQAHGQQEEERRFSLEEEERRSLAGVYALMDFPDELVKPQAYKPGDVRRALFELYFEYTEARESEKPLIASQLKATHHRPLLQQAKSAVAPQASSPSSDRQPFASRLFAPVINVREANVCEAASPSASPAAHRSSLHSTPPSPLHSTRYPAATLQCSPSVSPSPSLSPTSAISHAALATTSASDHALHTAAASHLPPPRDGEDHSHLTSVHSPPLSPPPHASSHASSYASPLADRLSPDNAADVPSRSDSQPPMSPPGGSSFGVVHNRPPSEDPARVERALVKHAQKLALEAEHAAQAAVAEATQAAAEASNVGPGWYYRQVETGANAAEAEERAAQLHAMAVAAAKQAFKAREYTKRQARLREEEAQERRLGLEAVGTVARRQQKLSGIGKQACLRLPATALLRRTE